MIERRSYTKFEKVSLLYSAFSIFSLLKFFLKKVTASKNTQNLKTKYGNTIKIRINTSDISEGAIIFSGYEYPLNQLPLDTFKTIVDVGAHIGMFSIYVNNFTDNNVVKFHLMEPSSSNINLLKENISNNINKNFKISTLALSNTTSQGYLNVSKEPDYHHLVLGHSKTEQNEELVNTIDIDTFCKNNNISEIDLLKIDIEGAEFKVFQSFPNIIFSKTKYIFIELHYLNSQNNRESFIQKYVDGRFEMLHSKNTVLLLKNKNLVCDT